MSEGDAENGYSLRIPEYSEQASGPEDEDEDTEDASETDDHTFCIPAIPTPASRVAQANGMTNGGMGRSKKLMTVHDFPLIKDQVYEEKLAQLKEQLHQVATRTHPEYLKRFIAVKQEYEERLLLNDAFLAIEKERIEDQYREEKKAAVAEFEDRKLDLKESIIHELEEKKRQIESERTIFDLLGEENESKPVPTRKLRRRAHDAMPSVDKRKRVPANALSQVLDEAEISEDLKNISKGIAKNKQ